MPNGDLVTKEKNAGIAVILGLFIPGAGVMYGGRIGLGILILPGAPSIMQYSEYYESGITVTPVITNPNNQLVKSTVSKITSNSR